MGREGRRWCTGVDGGKLGEESVSIGVEVRVVLELASDLSIRSRGLIRGCSQPD